MTGSDINGGLATLYFFILGLPFLALAGMFYTFDDINGAYVLLLFGGFFWLVALFAFVIHFFELD
jgi:hypothetical protein